MVQKSIFLRILAVTSLSLFSFLFSLFAIDPKETNVFAFILFYGSLFIFLWGSFFLSGALFSKLSKKEKFNFYNFLAKSGLFSFFIAVLIILQHLDRFNPLNLILLFSVIVLLEFILSKNDNL